MSGALSQRSHFHLTQLYSGQSPFWDYHQAFWQEYAAAMMAPPPVRAKVEPLPGAGSAGGNLTLAAELGQVAGRRSFSKIPLVATALSTGHEAGLQQLCSLMDQVNLVLQILNDILALRRDLRQRAYSYPIMRTLIAAGLDPHQPYIPEQVLGASVLTGSIQTICQESLATLGACRGIAEALSLPTFQAYLANVEDMIGEVKALFSLKAGGRTGRLGQPKPARQKLPFAPHFDSLNRALNMAERYLLSDLTFRESWDIQRGHQPHMPELVGSAFPIGLVVEILCRHGHNLAQQVSQVYATLRSNGFRYYDFSPLPPDADDLGLLLRLFRYSAPQEKPIHRQIVETPLRWMKQSILPSGQIPVWLKQAGIEDEGPQESSILIWGNSCSSTEANLLLGLARLRLAWL